MLRSNWRTKQIEVDLSVMKCLETKPRIPNHMNDYCEVAVVIINREMVLRLLKGYDVTTV